MPEYDDTNRGVLFANDRKTTDRHPDYTGTLNVEGVDRFLSGWINMSKNKGGKKWLSLSLGKRKDSQEPRAPRAKAPPPRAQPSADVPFDDDLAF